MRPVSRRSIVVAATLLVVVALTACQPKGNVDAVRNEPYGVRVIGWAHDPDVQDAVDIHVYADGKLVGGGVANIPRPDVVQNVAGTSATTGFNFFVETPRETREICLYALDKTGDSNVQLGCRIVPHRLATVGSIDTIEDVGSALVVRGWAIDEDWIDPAEVRFLRDGVDVTTIVADEPRADIAAAFPEYGAEHGFTATIPKVGNVLCAYGIDPEHVLGPLIGCRWMPGSSWRPPPGGTATPVASPVVNRSAGSLCDLPMSRSGIERNGYGSTMQGALLQCVRNFDGVYRWVLA
jgi:hypothetical protein